MLPALSEGLGVTMRSFVTRIGEVAGAARRVRLLLLGQEDIPGFAPGFQRVNTKYHERLGAKQKLTISAHQK